jgi:hypothetical protein
MGPRRNKGIHVADQQITVAMNSNPNVDVTLRRGTFGREMGNLDSLYKQTSAFPEMRQNGV